jgi:GH24 family phage-related lysozyme (muramidase)
MNFKTESFFVFMSKLEIYTREDYMKLSEVIKQQHILNINQWDTELTREVQQYLAELGLYSKDEIDGIVGPKTKKAFATFKQVNKQQSPNVIGAGSGRLLLSQTTEGRLAINYATKLIKELEGCELKVYPDPLTKSRPYTVGYGSTRTLDGKEWTLGTSITQEMADKLLMHELLNRTLEGCRKIPCWIRLYAEQQAALLSFAYSVGPNFYGNSGFNTITKVLRKEQLDRVPEALMLYVNSGIRITKGLTNRRKAEVSMWNSSSETITVLQEVKVANTLAERVVQCCDQRGYTLDRRPNAVNIIGVEGLNLDGTKNNDAPDGWNDIVGLLTFVDNKPSFVCLYQGTTEPGAYYTDRPLNKNGAARLQLGQHKDIWRVGLHRGYEALQQVGPATLVRDSNKNHLRDNKVTVEYNRGVNLHTTKTTNWRGSVGNSIGRWSAGCVVIKNPSHFLAFMKHLKQSHQYRSKNSTRFTFTLLWKDWL